MPDAPRAALRPLPRALAGSLSVLAALAAAWAAALLIAWACRLAGDPFLLFCGNAAPALAVAGYFEAGRGGFTWGTALGALLVATAVAVCGIDAVTGRVAADEPALRPGWVFAFAPGAALPFLAGVGWGRRRAPP